MSLDYLLFSNPNMPPKIKYECEICGETWEGEMEDKLDEQRCKKRHVGNNNIKIREPLIMSGLFCWVSAFREAGGRGTMKATIDKDYLEKFDIVHANVTPGHPTYVEALREAIGKNSDTKIIANVDYAASLWENINPRMLRNQLSMADFVFHVEPIGAKLIGRYIERDVPCIPHPVDVEKIKKYRKQPHESIVATCQWHRYRNTWSAYYYSLYKLPVKRVLCNVAGQTPPLIDLECFFDEIMPSVEYSKYIGEFLAQAYMNVDLAPDLTYGRGIVEAAAMGVPTIGSSMTTASNIIFPELTCHPFDHIAIESNARKLLENTEFAKEMSDQGQDRCASWSTENSYKRIKEELERGGII